jgi:hypothetical protein
MLISAAYSADFTTYIGGASQTSNQSTIGGLATDSEGNTYVTGSNAFVTKLDPAGNIVFTNTFGPSGSYSYGYSIAVDSSNNIWVGGQTVAANFPLVNALQSSVVSSGSGFLMKMGGGRNGALLFVLRRHAGRQRGKWHSHGQQRQCLCDWLDRCRGLSNYARPTRVTGERWIGACLWLVLRPNSALLDRKSCIRP